MTIAGNRLRAGKDQWDEPAEFFACPDRNMTGSALLNDEKGKLYYLQGVSSGHGYRTCNALVMSTSTSNGATWAHPRLVNPERNDRMRINQPIASIFTLRDGTIVAPSDAPKRPKPRGSALWMSKDQGATWTISEGTIAGIHTGVVELKDGSLLAFGRALQRRENIDGRMPQSISKDRGKTWQYSASPFPPIHGGQRLVLRRLREGPIMFGSFAGGKVPVLVTDAAGKKRPVKGFFVALSYDEGKTWPVKRLVSHDRTREEETMDGRKFTMSRTQGEPSGYFACTQSPDGVVHLISSNNYYAFNLKWIETPPSAE